MLFLAVAIVPFVLSLASALPNAIGTHDLLERRGTESSQRVSFPGLEAAGMNAYLEKAIAFDESAGDETTTNTFSIHPAIGSSPSQKYLNLMLADEPADDAPAEDEPATTPKDKPAAASAATSKSGQSPIKNIANSVYLTDVTVGSQEFKLVLDTGSADTWLVSTPFQCLGSGKQEVDIKICKFGKEYKKGPTFKQIPGLKLATAYSDGERLDGIMAKESVSIGNIAAKNQTIGLVQRANWHGDGTSSGLMGMAFPAATRSKGQSGAAFQRYDPVFTTMWKQGAIKAVFAISLNRLDEGPGVLSVGGLPTGNVKYAKEFAKAPMEKMALRSAVGGAVTAEHTLYVVKASGFQIGGKTIEKPANLIVDSGTTLSYLPADVVDAIAKAWSPPIERASAATGILGLLTSALTGQLTTSCTSKAPKFAIIIGGKHLLIDGKELLLPTPQKGICTLSVTKPGAQGLSLLGGPFLKSVLAVFDVGAAEMRFHQRIR